MKEVLPGGSMDELMGNREEALRAERTALVEDIQALQKRHPLSSQDKEKIDLSRSRLHEVSIELSAIDNEHPVHQ